MSIQNRKLAEGSYTVEYESKLQTLKGRIYCLFKGHKEVDLCGEKYCISCWKEL